MVTMPEYGVDDDAKLEGSTPICKGKGVVTGSEPAFVTIHAADGVTVKGTEEPP
jgi:hypothetical protein